MHTDLKSMYRVPVKHSLELSAVLTSGAFASFQQVMVKVSFQAQVGNSPGSVSSICSEGADQWAFLRSECGLRRSREGDALELGVDFSSNINYLSCILLSSRILSLGTLSSLISCLFPILCALIYRYFRGVPSMISWRSFGIFSIMIPCRHFLAHLQNAGGWAMFCWFGDPFLSLQALSLPHGGAGPC